MRKTRAKGATNVAGRPPNHFYHCIYRPLSIRAQAAALHLRGRIPVPTAQDRRLTPHVGWGILPAPSMNKCKGNAGSPGPVTVNTSTGTWVQIKGQISRRVSIIAVIVASLVADAAWGQASAGSSPAPATNASTASGMARGTRRNNRAPATPRNPVPILPALPAPNDRSFYASNDVPHGRVEQVNYKTSAGADKRMRVYLPPDYDADAGKRYPVLYLNHGGGENDSHWSATNPSSGGFANFILDNLIAAGKARPMIIVMPNTSGVVSGTPPTPGEDDACSREYLQDILPYVDSHYRTRANRESRAVAGLSMGGFVVLNTGLTHLDTFGGLFVFSSGYWPDQLPAFEQNIQPLLSQANINDRFRMPIYFAAGETDIALLNSQRTLAVFNNCGVRNFWVLSSNGHEWLNWRRYLYQTAQIMFPEDR
jgi:enterochelin esterase family protein